MNMKELVTPAKYRLENDLGCSGREIKEFSSCSFVAWKDSQNLQAEMCCI